MEDPTVASKQPRSIGGLLMIGIILLPIVFYWFLLRPGYSTASRVGAGLYLALGATLGLLRGLQGY